MIVIASESRILFLQLYFYLLLEVSSVTKVSKYPFHLHGSARHYTKAVASLFGDTRQIKQRIGEDFIQNADVSKRFKRQEGKTNYGPVNQPSLDYSFGHDSKVGEQFRKKQEKYRIRNGGFLPPSACPGYRPYIFYCDPRKRTGPINPATGKPWPNGIYFPPSTSNNTTIATRRQALLRPPCDSILCPVGGNEGYGYTGLEGTIGKSRHDSIHAKNCTSLLCPPSDPRIKETTGLVFDI